VSYQKFAYKRVIQNVAPIVAPFWITCADISAHVSWILFNTWTKRPIYFGRRKWNLSRRKAQINERFVYWKKCYWI